MWGPGPDTSAKDMSGPGPHTSRSAARDGGHDPDPGSVADRGGEVACALAVDVDVHERAHLAALVQHEIRHRQGPECFAHGCGLDLEALRAACLGREQARQEDYCHADASTERIGGRCR